MTQTSLPVSAHGSTPFASTGQRFVAYLIDGLLPLAILFPALIAARIELVALAYVVILALGIYQWRGVATTGQTIGKRLFGIRVVDAESGLPIGWGRALLRWFVLGLIGSACFVLVLIQPFVIGGSPRRQAWHDRAASTVVVLAGEAPRSTPSQVVSAVAGTTAVPAPPARPSLASGGAASPPPPPPSAVAGSSPLPAPAIATTASMVPPPPPASPVAPPPVSHPTGAAPGPAPVAEHTIAAVRPRPGAPVPPPTATWRLVAEDGTTIVVDGIVVVGREPDTALVPGAVAVAINDPDRTMSKTHAALRALGDILTAEDLDSTNGVYLVEAGTEQRIPSRESMPLTRGQQIAFGGRTYVVERTR